MIDNKICVGVIRDEIMAIINPNIYEKSIAKQGCKKMNFTGKSMKSYFFLNEDAYDVDLYYWLNLTLEYNPITKARKKRKNI